MLKKQQSPQKFVTLVGDDNIGSVVVNDRVVRCLLDTGSMVTTISKQYYDEHLTYNYPLLSLNKILEVEGAAGEAIPYEGYIEIGVALGGSREVIVPVLVVQSTEYNSKVPMIIGTNVLKAFRDMGVNCKNKAWIAAMDVLKSPDATDVAVYCKSTIKIPANKSVTVEARIGANRIIQAGVLEPVYGLPAGVVMPPCAVTVNNKNTIFVKLMNLNARAVKILKRQRIATLTHAIFIDQVHCANQSVREEPAHNSTIGEKLNIDLDSTELHSEQKTEVKKMLERCQSVFAKNSTDLGSAKGVKHKIRVKNETPFRERSRRIPPAMYDEVKKHIQEMLAAGAIRHSNSPWSSNVVLVRKKDGALRVCIDYRKLNARTIRDAYSMPLIEATLDRLVGAKWFSTLDLQAGYWQIEMDEESKAKTAFKIGDLGFFEAERMPFGLTNAPATFQRLMEQTLADLTDTMAYLDDVIIFSRTFEDHLKRLEAVFIRLQREGLKLKPSKCHLFKKRVNYLGHVISEDGIEADPEKIRAVANWPIPQTVHELRSVLGFFGYYRRFVKNYSKLMKPLYENLQGHENIKRVNKKTNITLGDRELEAFFNMKQKLTSLPILAYADFDLPFELHTDASKLGLGAVLYQYQDGKKRVIAYASRGLRSSEINYSAHKLEFLALKWAVCEKFRDYLYGQHFSVFTDNNPLCYVLTTAKLDAAGHRWLADLSAFDFSISYRCGKRNIDADALSRQNRSSESVENNADTEVITPEVISAVCGNSPDDIEHAICFSQDARMYGDSAYVSTTVTGANKHLWQRRQEQDPVLYKIRDLVKRKVKPTAQEFALLERISADFRGYWRTWDKLILEGGVLFREREISGKKHKQLILPEIYRIQALQGLHDNMGHLGRDRTMDLVQSRFFWPSMSDSVQDYIKKCLPCIRRKAHIPARAPLINIITTQPLELLCIDFLSLEPCKGGIENILVITDHFTRYAHAIPTKNQTAKTTANVLVDFFMHYGFPLKLHSDQGRNFESAVIKEVCELVGVQKTRTTPYHPMGNGMCERFNSTLLNMLGTLEDDQKEDWKSFVAPLVHAYNCTKHDTTGFSPFFLMFGRHPRIPVDIAMGIEFEESATIPTKQYAAELKEKLELAYKIASQKNTTAAAERKGRYDEKVRGATVQVGDRVLVKNVGLKGRNKLANKFKSEPYLVVKQPNADIPVFVVESESGRKSPQTLHRNLLLPVNFLPLKPQPMPRRKMHQRTCTQNQEEPLHADETRPAVPPRRTQRQCQPPDRYSSAGFRAVSGS